MILFLSIRNSFNLFQMINECTLELKQTLLSIHVIQRLLHDHQTKVFFEVQILGIIRDQTCNSWLTSIFQIFEEIQTRCYIITAIEILRGSVIFASQDLTKVLTLNIYLLFPSESQLLVYKKALGAPVISLKLL